MEVALSVSSVFRSQNSGNMEAWTWRGRHVDMETWRHGDMETWRHGDMETWRHGDMKTRRHGDGDIDMETWNQTSRHGNMETCRKWRKGKIVK